MFHDRVDAGQRLVRQLQGRAFHDPVVVAVSRGGVVVGAELARGLNAELDVVLAAKLRTPGQPLLAVGAVGQDGRVYLNRHAAHFPDLTAKYLERECEGRLGEVRRGQDLIRSVRPPVPLRGRSVLVTDDGIATGSTMLAALRCLRAQEPRELIVAVPVVSVDSALSLEEVGRHCDELVCLHSTRHFWDIDQFYEDFRPVSDEQIVALLRAGVPASVN